MITSNFFIGFSIIFFGYIIQSSSLYYFFYVLKAKERDHWKTQPNQGKDDGDHFYFWPLLERKKKKNHPKSYRWFTSLNLLIASCVAGVVSDFYCQRKINMIPEDQIWNLHFSSSSLSTYSILNPIHFFGFNVNFLFNYFFHSSWFPQPLPHWIAQATIVIFYFLIILIEFILILFWQIILEYYWHILMHLPFFYRNFHKFHHHFKAPEVWNDLYIHPFEAFGYYLILNSPAALFPCHLSAYLLYMIVCGLCGVIDHSGIKSLGTKEWQDRLIQKEKTGKLFDSRTSLISNLCYYFLYLCSLVYNASDHDRHHSHWAVNYGFPMPLLDIFHNTYEGFYFGRDYMADKKKWGKVL